MNTITQEVPQNKIGAWRGGLMLLRASWSTFKLDKELIAFPLYSIFTSIIWFLLMAIIFAFVTGTGLETFDPNTTEQTRVWGTTTDIIYGAILLFGSYVIANFFSAGLIASAIHRFEGGDPSVKYGMDRAKKRFGSLLGFSAVQATVGVILRTLEERVPLAGKIAVIIVDVAWAIVSMFAVAVIVMSEKPIGPIAAVRQSATIFKNTWAKNFTGGLTMGLVFFVGILLWVALGVGAAALASFHLWTAFITIPVLAITFFAMIAIFAALSSIFNAALYYYATTGKSPTEFDGELLHAAFKPKKKWFA